ncbi:enolase C-terminal domain-like protein [Kribbella sp. NPDC051586]|uniref:enolase C-terminal domain-like protein n=1 Tax=Kribbella sp. NPDC051586 TaxID=3364118 RepID=UPI0037A42B8F
MASAYTIPTDAAEADGTFAWDSTTLVFVQVQAAGCTGTGWTYGSVACAAVVDHDLASVVCGRDAMDVAGSWTAMVVALRNIGRPGVAGMALSAVDCALWDLKARLLDLPLHLLLGAVHDQVPVYGSGGFTSYDDAQLSHQLNGWVVDQRIPRVKIKIGESRGTCTDRDLHRIKKAREIIGPATELYVDANGGYTVGQAVRIGEQFDELGVTWFEEPVSSDDLDGLRHVRSRLSCDVTAGEYGYDLVYFDRMCRAEAVDCVQVDVTRCGGITELLRIAALAAARGLQVSGHCAPHQHVAALAAVPNLRHLEWFHDHVRIEQLVFDGTADPAGGAIRFNAAPGHGLTWRPSAAEPFRVR